MVFETVVTDLLNKILADYVENLDSKQLKIGIWGGDVVLNNLKLRENALDELNLPLQLVSGYLGQLVLKIPWKNLYSQPVVAQIEDLHILISPKQAIPYDAEKEEKFDLQNKKSTLQALEDAQQKELDKDKPKGDPGFTEKLTAQIVNNLQVKIANVHIRYEDTSSTGKPMAFGATLYDLEIYTTDENWLKTYLTQQVSRVYKIANLDSLSIYMNCNTELFSGVEPSKLPNAFRDSIARKELVPARYNYVIGPISSIAKLRLNMNPEYDSPPFEIPKIDLSLEMDKLNIGLTSTQFQDILKLADSMNRMQLGARYRKYRPFNTPYKNHKAWWKFAITAVLEEDIRKKKQYWQWNYIRNHRQLCRDYAKAIKEKWLAKKPPTLLVEKCEMMEKQLNLFNLIMIRQQVKIDVNKLKQEEETTKKSRGWFGGFFGGGSKAGNDGEEDADISKKIQAAMTPEEMDKLYKAIGYEENTVPLDLPEHYVATIMNFKLFALEIGLYDDTIEVLKTKQNSLGLQTIMLLNFSLTTCDIQQRPAASAISVTAGMKQMQLSGLDEAGRDPPILIESKFTQDSNLLDIFFETNPLDQKCDQRIKVHANPLQIVYNSDTILHLIKTFSPPKSVNLSEFQETATEKMSKFKERSATGMQFVIDNRSLVEVDIKFQPNLLIVPLRGKYVPDESSLIVVSLGQLHITSTPHEGMVESVATLFESGADPEVILKTIMEKAYDKYNINFRAIQVIIVKPHEPWEKVLNAATLSEMHILRPTSLAIAVDLCVVGDDPRLAKTKVDISLPAVKINITENRIYEALDILTSIPTPESDIPEPAPLMKAVSSASSMLSVTNFLSAEAKKVKSAKKPDISTEIIQYTDLEVNFTLKEFNVTLYRMKSLDEKSEASPIDDEDPNQFLTPPQSSGVNSPDAVTVPETSVYEDGVTSVYEQRLTLLDIDDNVQKLITFQILQLEANMAQRTYEMVAEAKLGAINFTQFDHSKDKYGMISVINTPNFSKDLQYLLTISYTMANKASPEFTTKYNSTEQLIVVNFSALHITLHQEYLLNLLELQSKLQNKFETLMAVNAPSTPQDRVGDAAAGEGVLSKLSTIMEEASEESLLSPVVPKEVGRKRRSKVVESIKINVIAKLEQVALLITCHTRPIASMQVQHFDAGVIIKSSYTEVKLRLKDIHVTDLNPKSIHTSILSIVGNNALSCEVVLYNLDETSNYNSDDMKINVEIGCVKIVYLKWFVNSVLLFLDNFKAAQEAIALAGAVAADAAKETALDAYEKATRMRINVKLKAPIIVVPVDSTSNNAIILDLGFLKLSNSTSELDVQNEKHGAAIIDEMILDLNNVKIYKCTVRDANDDTGISLIGSVDTIDIAYGIKSDVNILNPMSFTLAVKRNLSFGWYHDAPEMDIAGRLKSIELNLFMEDYAMLMSILNRNFNEGQDEFPKVVHPHNQKIAVDVHKKSTPTSESPSLRESPSRRTTRTPSTIKGSRSSTTTVPKKGVVSKDKNKQKIYEALKFNLQFDGIIANLKLSNNEGLACFGLYFMSLKGNKLVDETLSVSLVLCNIQIDDTRRVRNKSGITKYLSRKEWKSNHERNVNFTADEITDLCNMERNYMLDLTAIIKEDDTFAEVRVCGFDLIICVDYLLQLADFFKLPEEDDIVESVNPKPSEYKLELSKSNAAIPLKQQPSQIVENEKKINLVLYIEEPDIILVETLEDINSNAIIFNAQAKLNYRSISDKQLINGQIDGLKMFMCSFMPERREATKHYIIHPCVISLQGSTPEQEGLHISLQFSEIIVNISPATIELVNKALNTISASSAGNAAILNQDVNYNELWEAKKFKEKDHWFIKIDEAEDALEIIDSFVQAPVQIFKTEKCVVEIPSITLVIEMGVGYYTTPLLSIDTKLSAIVTDWSHNMRVKGSLCLSTNYYNQALAVWEPVIELNERNLSNGRKDYLPWELNFNLEIEKKKNEFDETIEEETKKIVIHAEENLEMTVSKTCLDLLGVLGEAFSQAIDSNKGLIKPDVIAPYVVENDTGFDISINFRRGIFTLHECHMPNATTTNTLNTSLVFKVEANETDITPELVQDCNVSVGGRAFLQTKSLSSIQSEEDEEYNIYVKVGGIDKEVVLPVSKSDKRYFTLFRDVNQDPWGIVSEVSSEYGTTRINIHGVVNVHNHFTTSIKIIRLKPQSREKIIVGEVGPGKVFHVPLHAIYAESKDLFFCIDGYHVSIQGIRWNDSPTNLEYTRHIQCDPIETFEPLYINAMRKKTEVFFETTNKYKLLSAFYTIHLRPPLYLRNALPINIKVSVAGCSVHYNNVAKPIEQIDEVETPGAKLVKEDFLDYGEKQVDPGDVLHLPTVKLSGKGREGKSYLVVRLIQYLEKDWSCTTEITGDDVNLVTWTFASYDSAAKMDMDLCVRFDNRYGSLMITLFSPFWLINKTGQMLSYKTDMESLDILYHPPEYNGPILFSFREKSFLAKKCATIRVDNGEWSDKIPLDVAGSIGQVTCKANDSTYEIGVHNHLTHNSLTKQITFIPFYIATNKCDFDIELQEQSRPGDPWSKVEPDACLPLWPKNDSDHMMVAKVKGQRTVPFNYAEAQCTLLQLTKNIYGGINVDVQATEGAVYITFTKYNPGDAPGLIINHTSYPVTYLEKGSNLEIVLKPLQEIFYTWAAPTEDKLLVFGRNSVETDLRRDGVGELVLTNGAKGFWVSFLDGLQRVLLFTEVEAIATRSESSATLQSISQSIELRIHGIGLSVVNNETGVDILYLGITSSGIIWESKKESKKRFKQMNIYDTQQIEAQFQTYTLDLVQNVQNQYTLDGKFPIDFNHMTLRKKSLRNIRRIFYPGIWVSMNTSLFQTQFHAKICKIQIDNQLTDCIFPVVLAPIAPPKSLATTTALKPFIECSMVQRIVPNSNVKQFKYASVLIQEFHFKVDLLFLTALANLNESTITDAQAAKLFNENVEYIEKPLAELVETHSRQEQKNYYDNLHLGPLKIHVSFSMAGSDISALPGILSTLVQGVGVTLTDVNDVVFRLAFFERDYQFFTQSQLNSEITAHYVGQALKQLYVLVLGLDVLGNPYGLVVGIKKGVEDLFYEPFQGAIQGPGEFAEGLVLGVKSLFGHTVGGAAGAVSKITGAVGKGLAALTFDEEYQKKRRQAMNKKPANFQEGIARSGKGLVMGFVDGVTGVVTKPVAGAKDEGVGGFFKGLGKGAIGLVARPTAGVVDFASGSFDAVKRATEVQDEAQRLRPPRFLHLDNVLRPYNRDEAEGNKILREVEKGKYANTDSFVHCDEIVQKHEYVLVTNHRIIYVTKNDLFGTWTVQWTYLWNEIAAIKSTERGVELTLKKEGKKMGFFSTHESQRKIILLPQKLRRDNLTEITESLRVDI